MKNFKQFIEAMGAVTVNDPVPSDGNEPTEAVDPINPEDALNHPAIQDLLQRGYKLKGVSQNDAGQNIAMLVKGVNAGDVQHVELT